LQLPFGGTEERTVCYLWGSTWWRWRLQRLPIPLSHHPARLTHLVTRWYSGPGSWCRGCHC